jgi:two-component system sensor histidine kinase PilS (NtrC family)
MARAARVVTGVSHPRPAPETPLDQVRVRLTWLFVFRAVVMTVMVATTAVLRGASDGSIFQGAAAALTVVAAVSYGSILAGALWLRRFGSRGVRPLALVQLGFDALVAAVVVALTGGVESVFVFVFSLTVLNAAAVMQRQGAVAIAIFAALLYALVFGLEVAGMLRWFGIEEAPSTTQLLPSFLTNTASFVLVAALGAFLSEQLQRTSERLDVAQAQIAHIEELYHAVLESLPSGVLTVDAGGEVLYVNGAGAQILGKNAGELVGKPLAHQAPALVVDDVTEYSRFERQAGGRTLGGSVARLTGFEGLAGRVVVFQDLTELRRLQQDVARAERLAELGRFAAGLAHEIRNPLAAMIGCLQLLQDDTKASAAGPHDSSEEASRMLGIVQREAERLSSLVTEFLTYARPAPPRIEAVRLLGVAGETVAAMRTGLPPQLQLEVEGDGAVVADCDPSQVRQALWNLVRNAAQAAGGDGRAGRVRVEVRAERDCALLVVDDDGPGVPPDIRARVFEPFFTTRADGTGLGLATVHQTLAQQGGGVRLADSPLGGARFEVRLPRSSQNS